MHEPLISVAMGVHYQRDTVAYLQRSVVSIMAQTMEDFEFLICVYNSTDAAYSFLEQAAEQDQRIRILYAPSPGTLAHNLNQCLRYARGKYVARMDDDDFSYPQRFQKQLDFMEKNPKIAFVGCAANLERDGEPAGIWQFPARPEAKDFLFVQPFLHPTLLFRREVLEKVGGYCEEPRCLGCEDYDLLLRIYEAGYWGENIQEPLFTYTLPPIGSKKRTMNLRWNEVKTRCVRFRALGLLPGAFPYVIKPVVVGLIPSQLLQWMKRKM